MKTRKRRWSNLRRMTHDTKGMVGEMRVALLDLMIINDDMKQIKRELNKRQRAYR